MSKNPYEGSQFLECFEKIKENKNEINDAAFNLGKCIKALQNDCGYNNLEKSELPFEGKLYNTDIEDLGDILEQYWDL